MKTRIVIPSSMRSAAGNADVLELAGSTVGEALADLATRYPELAPQLFQDDGQVHRFVHVFVNDESIADGAGLATPLRSGDEILVVPALAGG